MGNRNHKSTQVSADTTEETSGWDHTPPAPSVETFEVPDLNTETATVPELTKVRRTRAPHRPVEERLASLSTVEKSVYFAKRRRVLLAEISDLEAKVGPKAVALANEQD